ncbi:hypothetical protein [Novosphingobium sediminicola]|uniref:Glycosyltransferase RgtA/B/C/D-like domain-containing protein n=1 Tax=Novosphingobium sediminicola TaxID=563162 RepID=A0A7W6G6E8_9SPHN|nr:hypothetical protein [Novosphingobium sediminicola]MBB3955228.1 hypothetical protein [Novosphingobium sediminicola]
MTFDHTRLFPNLRRVVVAGLLIALVAGMLLPVYSDEIGWRLQERAWLDGLDKLYSENCGPNTLAVPPFFMWPVRWYSAFFNTRFPDPLFVRISGVGYAIVFIIMVLRLVKQIGRTLDERQILAIIASALMGLGVMPLLLVWSRPEQPIFLAATAAVLIASAGWRSPGNMFAPFNGIAYTNATASPGTAWRRSLTILALALIAMSYHFKAVLVVPAFAACIIFASRGRRALFARGVAIVLLLLATGSAAKYWVNRVQCPADPIIAHQHARNNLAGQLDLGTISKTQLVLKVLQNYKLHNYVERAAPAIDPMSSWLPLNMVSRDEMNGWRGGMTIIWAAALLAAIISFIGGVRNMWREKVIPPEPVIALMLLGAVSIWCVSQYDRNVYEASFVLPLLMLAIILAMASPHRWEGLRRWISTLALAIGPLMLLSIVLVSGLYGPRLIDDAQRRDWLPWHPWSVPVFGYHASYKDIMGAARQCNLPMPREARHLLLDDVTYFAYMQSRMPDHELAVLPPHFRGSINDPVAYLAAQNSDGILMRCKRLPPFLQGIAHRSGNYCCVTPADWSKLPPGATVFQDTPQPAKH